MSESESEKPSPLVATMFNNLEEIKEVEESTAEFYSTFLRKLIACTFSVHLDKKD